MILLMILKCPCTLLSQLYAKKHYESMDCN